MPNTLSDKSEELCKGAFASCASPRGSDSSVLPERAKVVSKALDPPNCVNWPGPPMYGQRKKKSLWVGISSLLAATAFKTRIRVRSSNFSICQAYP